MSGIIYGVVGTSLGSLDKEELLITLRVTDIAGSEHSLNTVPILVETF